MLLERIPVRIRLSLGHALWMACIFVCIGFGVYRTVEDSLVSNLDNALMNSASAIRATFYPDRSRFIFGKSLWRSVLERQLSGRLPSHSLAQLVDMSGNVRAKAGALNTRLPVTAKALGRAEKGIETYETFFSDHRVPLRQITLPVYRDGRFTGQLIQVGSPLENDLATLRNLKEMLILTLLLGLGISIIFGYLLTRWSFRPVVAITGKVAQMGIDDLDTRLPLTPANDELRVLIVTFNRMLDRLGDSTKQLRRFAGDVSHELRTPLAVLRGEADFALRRERDKDAYKEALRTISRECLHMSRVVEDLLLLARAQGNALKLCWQFVDVRELLDSVVGGLSGEFRKQDVRLKVEYVTEIEVVEIAATYLEMALRNILINAAKHSEPGSLVKLEVLDDKGPESQSLGVKFKVTDQGEGIESEELTHIFEAFYRADTARNRSLGGAGIGLSLAHALVKLHHGQVDVQSTVGQGSTFTVRIPCSRSQSLQVKYSSPKAFRSSKSAKSHLSEPVVPKAVYDY